MTDSKEGGTQGNDDPSKGEVEQTESLKILARQGTALSIASVSTACESRSPSRCESESLSELPNIPLQSKPKLQRTNTSKVEMHIARGSKPRLSRKNTSVGELGGIAEDGDTPLPEMELNGIPKSNLDIENTTIIDLKSLSIDNSRINSPVSELDRRNNNKNTGTESKLKQKPILRRRNTSRIEMELTIAPKPKLERRNTSVMELKCIDMHRSKSNGFRRSSLELNNKGEINSVEEKSGTGSPEFRQPPEFQQPKLLRRNSSKLEMEIARPPKAKLERRDTTIIEMKCIENSKPRSKWKGKMGKLGKLGTLG